MHFSLVLIGAHNGSKPAERIAEAQALKNASRPSAGKLARMLRILFEKSATHSDRFQY